MFGPKKSHSSNLCGLCDNVVRHGQWDCRILNLKVKNDGLEKHTFFRRLRYQYIVIGKQFPCFAHCSPQVPCDFDAPVLRTWLVPVGLLFSPCFAFGCTKYPNPNMERCSFALHPRSIVFTKSWKHQGLASCSYPILILIYFRYDNIGISRNKISLTESSMDLRG